MKAGRKKIYIIRRKIHGKSIMPTVGNFANINDIKNALEKAVEMARAIVATGRKPPQFLRLETAS